MTSLPLALKRRAVDLVDPAALEFPAHHVLRSSSISTIAPLRRSAAPLTMLLRQVHSSRLSV